MLGRVLSVGGPVGWIPFDVRSGACQDVVRSDDPVVKPSLPDRDSRSISQPVDSFCRCRLYLADDCSQRVCGRTIRAQRIFAACRGDAMRRPADVIGFFPVDPENCVHMVWHDNQTVDNHVFPNLCRQEPFLVHNGAKFIQVHASVNDVSKQEFPVQRATCHQIKGGGAVIKPLRPE